MAVWTDHIRIMQNSSRILAVFCALGLLAQPLTAAGTDEPEPPKQFDFEKFADAAREVLDKLTEEVLPLLKELGEKVGEVSEYQAPEVLPNGDIIIRRKKPEETAPEDEGEKLDL
jgi:hypothetical protein